MDQIKLYVREIKEKLNEGLTFNLGDTGVFYAIAGKINFKLKGDENLNLESFGLNKIKLPGGKFENKPEIKAAPESKAVPVLKAAESVSATHLPPEVKKVHAEKQVKKVDSHKGSLKWIWIGIFVPIIIAFILILVFFNDLIFENRPIAENKTI